MDAELPPGVLPSDEFLIPRVLFVGKNSFNLKALEMVIPKNLLYWAHEDDTYHLLSTQ